MSLSSAGVALCEPTQLYNILTRCEKKPSIMESNYLLLLDVRDRKDYEHNHCILARHTKPDDSGKYNIPFGINLTTIIHCIVYDSNTVSIIEDTPAVKLANQIANSGSRNTVMIVKGGYERFSAEYPFLRTIKIIYTQVELEHLPLYPSEILPLFLYLGDQRHAYNASLNYDMKINAHVNMSSELYPAFPEKIKQLHIPVEDSPSVDLLNVFDEVCEFLESCRKKSERVLVFGEKGISRSVVVVLAYLIKYKGMSLTEAKTHVKLSRPQVCPLQSFTEQLIQWEQQTIDKLPF